MAGDNFRVEVHSEGKEHFFAAVKLTFGSKTTATHYVNGLPERRCLECSGSGKTYIWLPGEGKERVCVEPPCPHCTAGKAPAMEAMILYWHLDEATPQQKELPFPLKTDPATEFLWNYLQTALYPEQPDHDGSNGKGFLVTTGDFWGHVEGSHYSILMVAPEWQMYGK